MAPDLRREFREVVERAMRDDGADAEAIAAAVARVDHPRVVYALTRIRREGRRISFDDPPETGVIPATPDGLRKVRRTLLDGRAGGAPTGTGVTWEGLVETTCDLWDWPDGPEPKELAVAEELGVSDRWIRRKASPWGGWDAVTNEAHRRLSNRNS